MKLTNIQRPINKEMYEFKRLLKKSISTNNIIIDEIINYILRRKGKQIRPTIVFLSAGLCGKITLSTYRAAVLIEILHTATLVHDDVVDESNFRRGYFSINAIWKNKYSVLVGDYLLSSGLIYSLKNDDFNFLKILSESVKQISEGEITQMKKTKTLDIDEITYFEIIRKKTASLFASCCEMAALSTSSELKTIKIMRNFGLNLGLAFQIRDDLFGYVDSNSGKPFLNDILEKKITLPLIYSLKKSNKSEKKKILDLIKDKTNLDLVIDFVKRKGGVEYCNSKMNQYIKNAENIINKFPSSEYKLSLIKLLEFIVNRKK